ncbi:MAG: SDR family oxidoreductase [Planctomycetota bacterium]|jgi:NAD(P)-dependent dehydrogenase (short-subunit alcohol dehydrogenase family)|nr:SDR family oxidoreductase [Planctomycetota bacterium]
MTLPCFDLSGRTAVVTGAGKGLGQAFAKALAASGASVLGISRNRPDLEKLKDEIGAAGGKFDFFLADILDEPAIREAAGFCLSRFGPPDALVNNAGLGRVNKPFEEITTEEWRRTVDNNLTGTFICSKYFGLEMIKRKKGKIVNLASMSGIIANKGVHCGPYEVSKLGIVALTRSLASEWCGHGITVNALAPGYIATKRNSEFFAAHPDFTREAVSRIPVGRIPVPDEIAGAMVFLCSDASDYMNGAVLVLDGGYTVW